MYCGNDAARCFGYDPLEEAIRDIVNEDNKCVLRDLVEHKNFGQVHEEGLNSIYINPYGVLALATGIELNMMSYCTTKEAADIFNEVNFFLSTQPVIIGK